ncbi:MAG: DUF547 domain-containing protein [Sedimentisphaerales bacterium]|nr:DUF547 domain-containing protein [Sedimentisphaerales bacterium]
MAANEESTVVPQETAPVMDNPPPALPPGIVLVSEQHDLPENTETAECPCLANTIEEPITAHDLLDPAKTPETKTGSDKRQSDDAKAGADASEQPAETVTENMPPAETVDSAVRPAEDNQPTKPTDKNTAANETQAKPPEAEKPDKSWPKRYDNYATLLKTYVDKQGNIDYFALRRLRRDLLEALKDLESVNRDQYDKWTREEKIAFWINAHNLCTLRLVIDNYPIKPRWPFNLMYPNGIMQIPGARNKIYFRLMEREYSLSEMERDILLKQFGEPRYLFSLSHATRGAGFLRREPFCAALLEQQTLEQWRLYLASPRGLKIDKKQNIVHLSDMFIWYKEAIIAQYGSVKRFRDRPEDIRSYLNCIYDFLSKEDADYLLNNSFTVKFISYDWSLNEQTPN